MKRWGYAIHETNSGKELVVGGGCKSEAEAIIYVNKSAQRLLKRFTNSELLVSIVKPDGGTRLLIDREVIFWS